MKFWSIGCQHLRFDLKFSFTFENHIFQGIRLKFKHDNYFIVSMWFRLSKIDLCFNDWIYNTKTAYNKNSNLLGKIIKKI